MTKAMDVVGRGPVRHAQAQGGRVTRSRPFEWLARAGLLARGAIYVIIAILAIKLALGDGGKATNQQGALKTLAGQPFGEILLVLMAIGLAGYALWRLTRAALGHGVEVSDDAKERIDGLVSGIGYAGLCVTAIALLAGGSGGGGGASPDKTTGGVLGWPGGPWIVGLVGMIIIGVGVEQGYKGISRKFLEQSRTEGMSPAVERSFTALGVLGYLARMVVFGLIGYFLVKAAIDFNPDEAVSLDGALTSLTRSALGPLALGIVAMCLLAFGLYSVVEARYRRV